MYASLVISAHNMFYKQFVKFTLALSLVSFIMSQVSGTNSTTSIQAGENFNAKITGALKPAKRFERTSNDDEQSQCSGDKMQFDYENRFTCKYDDMCYKTFQDCCPGFVERCGNQTSSVDSPWECNNEFGFDIIGLDGFKKTTGLWLIRQCASEWPMVDETRDKCEFGHISALPYSKRVDKSLPVVSKLNRFTYRNKFCAICNHQSSWVSYQVKATTDITPPGKLKEHGGRVSVIIPDNQPRRYCLGKNYVDRCKDPSDPLNDACSRGPVEIVKKIDKWNFKTYYKNLHCSQCDRDINKPGGGIDGPRGPGTSDLNGYNLVYTVGESNSHTTTYEDETSNCSHYDKTLQICRDEITTTAKDINFSNKFLVLITFDVTNSSDAINPALIEKHFDLDSKQISEFHLHPQDKKMGDTKYMVASFHLTLTPLQEKLLANHHNLSTYVESKKFLELFDFSGTYYVFNGAHRFRVIKVVTQRLACSEGRKLRHNDYRLNNDSDVLYETKTGRKYSLNEYSILNDTSYIILCSKLVLSNCPNGFYVKLFPNEFIIQSDLSLRLHNASNKTYQFGEYQISESLNESSPYTFGFPVVDLQKNGTIRRGNSTKNVIVSVCRADQKNYIPRIRRRSSTERHLLWIFKLGICGLIISSLFLVGLLVTYGLFAELRTLPGLNLMSLCLSMLLGNLSFLITKTRISLDYYLLVVSLHAMTVISYHASSVFSKSFLVPNPGKRWKTFFKYSLFVWLLPVVFIPIHLFLDKLFIFFLVILLLFILNVAFFIRLAVSLARNHNQSQLLKKKGRQNLKVCVKLATLTSFPWLFFFLGGIFPSFEVFRYLFIVFFYFQGCYISVAFLCTKKNFELYRKRFTANRKERRSTELKRQERKLHNENRQYLVKITSV